MDGQARLPATNVLISILLQLDLGKMTVTRPTLRANPAFFFFLSSSFPLSLLAICCWVSLLACPAALWLAAVAVAEVPMVDWAAPPLTDTFWPSKRGAGPDAAGIHTRAADDGDAAAAAGALDGNVGRAAGQHRQAADSLARNIGVMLGNGQTGYGAGGLGNDRFANHADGSQVNVADKKSAARLC